MKLLMFLLLWPTLASAKVDPKTVPGTVKWLCQNFEKGFDEAKIAKCKATSKASDKAYHQCLEVVNSGVGQKRLQFFGPAAEKCIAAQKSYTQKPGKDSRNAMRDICATAVKGSKAKGETCESPLDCLDGLACLGVKGASAGKCATPLAEGEACDTDLLGASSYIGLLQEAHAICAPGLFCSETLGKPRVCTAESKSDDPAFHQSAGAACRDSGQCKGVCDSGKCKAVCGSG